MLVLLGEHVVTFMCKMQKCIALSSGEAELNAQVLGISEGLGTQNVLLEMGVSAGLESQ